MSPQSSSEFRTILRASRTELAHSLVDSARLIPRFAEQIKKESESSNLDAFVERELICLIDYLQEYLGNGNPEFRDLYVGERMKMAYVEGDSTEERNQRIAALLESDRDLLGKALNGQLSKEAAEALEEFYTDLIVLFTREFKTELSILFVGDCYFLDVMAFLGGKAAQGGIAIRPHFVTSHYMAEVASDLRALAKESSFDLVFFSPFTYEKHHEFIWFLNPSNVLPGVRKLCSKVFPMLSDVEEVIDVFASHYDCPVYVHNTAALIRGDFKKRLFKNLITWVKRRQVRTMVDEWLVSYLAKKNRETFQHLYRFDELELLRSHSEMELGSVYYWHPIQHPAAMGKAVANQYAKICNAVAHLLKKKMVVCDLDNTLWDGVIGEGAVTHYQDRQETLKRLKAKGVLLAINSKNDPANVHWDGGVLSEDDFVFANINWEPKVNGFPLMEQELNLKMKDFVFVDDRRDERELVRQAFPMVKALDATNPQVWEWFEIWEMLLDADTSVDRTQMYKDRENRKSFVEGSGKPSKGLDRAKMFRELELKLTVTYSEQRDLKRVTELINRTNQFNMQGSRTTFSEVSEWHRTADFHVLQAQMSDRFGDMGVVCVLVVRESELELEIPVFVLSCRVFGYGVETAMLNQIKLLAASRGKRVVGRYVSTPQNMPCKDVYAQNGFEDEDGLWVFASFGECKDPEWLDVQFEGTNPPSPHPNPSDSAAA